MVVRCSSDLYEAARVAAAVQNITLSDYVRELIIRDLKRNDDQLPLA